MIDPRILTALGESARVADRYTVPIYVFHEDNLTLDRTGILLKVVNRHFVLTASHHLQTYCERSICLCLGFSKTRLVPIPLVNAKFHTTEFENGPAIRDIAAIYLTPEDVEHIPSRWEFLNLASVDHDTTTGEGVYLAFGYPTAWFKLEEWSEPKPLPFIGNPITPSNSSMFDPRVHLAIGFDRNAIQLPLD